MSKSTLKNNLKKLFEFDFESILSSDSSNDENVENEKRTIKRQVKRRRSSKKGTSSGSQIQNAKKVEDGNKGDNHQFSDICKYLETLENDAASKIQMKREILTQFMQKIVAIYKTKMGEILRKQETEMEDFKKKFSDDIRSELENWERYASHIKQQEDKLMKTLQQLRTVYKTSEIQTQKVKKIAEMHRKFFQKYEEMIKKHKSETLALKEVINKEIVNAKNDLISNSDVEYFGAAKKPF